MLRKCCLGIVSVLLLFSCCRAETVRIGRTQCLMQLPTGEDLSKRYVLFVGSGDYFQALYSCAGITASDGELLIPQADSRYDKPSAASDQIIEDLRPLMLTWAEEGYAIVLTGYSSGGYPATALAVYLADAGYTGKLYILDGIYGDYRGVVYNADYYRSHLSDWQVTICSSAALNFNIAERTRSVGEALSGDAFVTYLAFDITHNELQDYYRVIFDGEEFIHRDSLIGSDQSGPEAAETDKSPDSRP